MAKKFQWSNTTGVTLILVSLCLITLLFYIVWVGRSANTGADQISTGTLASGEQWQSTNVLVREDWNFSFLYPSNLEANSSCSDGGYCFALKGSSGVNTFFDRLNAKPGDLSEDEFYFGYAHMGDETGAPILDLYTYLQTIELTQGAEYDHVLFGPYEGLREITPEMERVYVRTGVSDVWYFYVQPATPESRAIFERILSTMKIEAKEE